MLRVSISGHQHNKWHPFRLSIKNSPINFKSKWLYELLNQEENKALASTDNASGTKLCQQLLDINESSFIKHLLLLPDNYYLAVEKMEPNPAPIYVMYLTACTITSVGMDIEQL